MKDEVAIEKCEFCNGTRRVIGRLDGAPLVRCEDCGMISTSSSTQIVGEGRKVKTLRKAKSKYKD